MSTQEITSMNKVQELSKTSKKGQYTLWQILDIWSLAAFPMGILSWIVYPAVAFVWFLHYWNWLGWRY